MAGHDVNETVKNITDDVRTIVHGELALFKAEAQATGKRVGTGVGMFGAAGYFGLNAVSLLFMAGGFGIGLLFTHFLDWPLLGAAAVGYAGMALLLLLMAGILALLGKSSLNKAKSPEEAINEAKATVTAVKGAVTRGTEQVSSGTALQRYEDERTARAAITGADDTRA